MSRYYLLRLVFSLGAVYGALCNAIPKENEISSEETELVLVSVIFRHGARTTYAFYPNDPNKNETFYPIGFGGLTNEGKMGEFQLGRYLKSLYGDFLEEDYTEDKVYVRSTDVTRTKMSAQLVLAGLFPPSDLQRWNLDLMWQPIPVAYKTEAEEDLFHPWAPCPYKVRVIDDLPNRPEIQEIYINPYKEIFESIREKSGKNISHPADMQDFYFILKTESDMDLIMPDWTQEFFPYPTEKIAATVYDYHNTDKIVRQINSGYMLKKILSDAQGKIDGSLTPKDRRIFLYSGHESTMGYMLSALNTHNGHVPPYGSALSFELRKSKVGDEYYMKLQYRNETEATEPIDLSVPGCDVLCPFEKFVELQNELIPAVSITEACQQEHLGPGREEIYVK